MPLPRESRGFAVLVTIRRRLMRQLGLLLPSFGEIREHRPVAAPLLLVAIFSLAGAFSIQPLVQEVSAGETARGLEILIWFGAVLSPVLMGGKGFILALLSWSALVLLGRDVRLRLLTSVFLYGEAILAVHGVAMASVLHLRGPDALSGLEDLYVPMGLEGLVPPGSAVLEAVARGATVFHLTWFLFLVTGLVRAGGLSPRAATLVAAGAWMLALSVTALRALAFS